MKAIRSRRKPAMNQESKSQSFFPNSPSVMRKKDAFFNSTVSKKANDEEKVAAKGADEKEKDTSPVKKKGNDEKEQVSKKDSDSDRSGSGEFVAKKNDEEHLQKKDTDDNQAPESFETALKNSKSNGNSMPDMVKAEMENKFGVSFDQVKIHNDPEAANLCKMINAKAFTHGSHIYFDTNKFNPETHDGKQLLAHELAHVIQQENNE